MASGGAWCELKPWYFSPLLITSYFLSLTKVHHSMTLMTVFNMILCVLSRARETGTVGRVPEGLMADLN